LYKLNSFHLFWLKLQNNKTMIGWHSRFSCHSYLETIWKELAFQRYPIQGFTQNKLNRHSSLQQCGFFASFSPLLRVFLQIYNDIPKVNWCRAMWWQFTCIFKYVSLQKLKQYKYQKIFWTCNAGFWKNPFVLQGHKFLWGIPFGLLQIVNTTS